MGFTCILKTNIFLVDRYWNFNVRNGVKHDANNQSNYQIIFTATNLTILAISKYPSWDFFHLKAVRINQPFPPLSPLPRQALD